MLLDSTEIITALLVARNLDMDTEMPTFQQIGNEDSTKRLSRVCRAESMVKVREEMRKMKELRKAEGSRSVRVEDFQDLEIRRVTRKESSRRKESRGLQAEDVDNSLIQDKSRKIQIVGSDVESLYPSLDAIEVAQIVYKCIMETEVKFRGVDYQEACRLIALTSSEQECRLGPLRRVLPVRRYVHGSRPGVTGEDPLGPDSGSQDQWEFPSVGKNGLTKLEKRLVIAQVAQKSVLALFKTHTYRFANKFFLQKRGGPIGLRSTCCVARLVMMWWDEQFLEVVKKSNLEIIKGARYMDDVRIS